VLKHILLGGGLAFAAAIQPGPLQAFLLARAAATGWRRTLPACLSPVLSDGPIALVSLVLLSQLPRSSHLLLRAAGGLLLLYLAGVTFLEWRRPPGPAPGSSAPRTLLEAALVNVLNPNPYLGWSLVLGPAVLAAWREHGPFALALVAAFYGTMCATLAGFVLLVGTTRFLDPRARRALVAVSSAVLAGLGLYLLVTSVSRFQP
jgi:threonine/homoserine/homoserine lactone efflux protein